MPPINWATVHATLLHRFGRRPAVTDAAGTATYADIFAHAAGIGRALLEAGARPGEAVATFLHNGRAAVAVAYGTQFAGVCETALNIAYSEAELRVVLGIAGCRLAVCGREHAGFFRDLGLHVIVAEEIAGERLQAARFPSVDAGLPGRMGFTSGTTGLPKGIVYSHATRFVANLALQASLPWLPQAGERVLLMTPFAHGASLQSFAWLDQGGEVVLHEGVDPERVRPLLEAQMLAGVFAAPTVLAKLTAAYGDRVFAGVRTIFTGTAPLPPAIYARARAMFGPVVRLTYGKTEVFNPITVLGAADADAWYAEGPAEDGGACVGWAGPGVELALGEESEVLIRARHISDGWLDASGLRHAWREDGFHATGDVGRFDDRGRLFLVARLSDAMKSGGYKIYPQEIERVLGPECVVLGWPSEYWGEIVVVAAEAPAAGWEARVRHACADLAPFKRPRFHFAVPALPRNGQGKVVRRHLLAALQQRWRIVDGPRPVLEEIG
jgi:malonyl-CoA/methylmalonyl-CoA synthetase